LDYLHELGIGTIYAAPFFKARTGSTHRYDVAEAHRIGPDIGTLEEFDAITKRLRELGMGWLQDIVPNHMVFHPENTWLMDVLEKGQRSEYKAFFDINWKHPDLGPRLMVPFLGEPLDKVIAEGQLELVFDRKGFHFKYFDTVYPASVPVYAKVLKEVAAEFSKGEDLKELRERMEMLANASDADEVDISGWELARSELFQAFDATKALDDALQGVLKKINGDKDKLREVHDSQYYRLCHWKETEKQINYRRFFTINELICLRMGKKAVFDTYHQFIKVLCEQDMVQGLRVDHIDGLYDPTTYLERLRELAGPDRYLIVEKILEGHEELPDNWPVQGNSGYDFLAFISNLYTDPKGEEKLTELYKKLVPRAPIDYEKLVFEKKMFILKDQMAGELENLLRTLRKRKLIDDRVGLDDWREALAVMLASFPVYRIYVNHFPLNELSVKVIDETFTKALNVAPERKGLLDHLRTLFAPDDGDDDKRLKNKLYFVKRSQQFTGPLAAKGVEDTAFYNYNRLLSLNEVGNSPEVFHLRRRHFHELMQYKLQTYPHSINATATHDTKRGEGSRMRLQVLSEIPDEWEAAVYKWIDIIRKTTPRLRSGQAPEKEVPTPNDLYFILQTLVGVMPIDGTVDDMLVDRVQEYLIKAFREAKENTNWGDPNESYETAVKDLVKHLLEDNEEFLDAFRPFFEKVAHYGWLYSLSQTMLKLTCPGVPDIYQGTELWDLSLVDPDNRRPVDYALRRKYLKGLLDEERQGMSELHHRLLSEPNDGRVKLYLIQKILHLRKEYKGLFDHGEYHPLRFSGKYDDHIVAFARRYEDQWCIVMAPRLLTQVVGYGEMPLGWEVWDNTTVKLPKGAPKQWRNMFRGIDHNYPTIFEADGTLKVGTIFDTFPVALLISEPQ
jgi:(1->4)-alpha-D-glucan 1-alpha-D-glucosylmutase